MRIDPDQIINERGAILARMIADFACREGCLGLFIRGSVAEGSPDPWSDIDATVVISAEHYERVTADRFLAPSNWGEFLYNSGGGDSVLCISHFRPFVKLDLFYHRPEDLVPSPWYTRPLHIAFDRDGSIQLLVERSRHLRFHADPVEVNHSINQGISCAHEVLRRIERGEFACAQHILGHLRGLMADADAFLTDAPPTGLFHFEKRCSDLSVSETVRKSYPSTHDTNAILNCLKQLVRVYRLQICRLDQRLALGRDLLRDDECLDFVTMWPEHISHEDRGNSP